MKTTQVLACSLAVGAMIFAAGKASADVIQKLNISGTATYRVAGSCYVRLCCSAFLQLSKHGL
jgi:hypothetical protein